MAAARRRLYATDAQIIYLRRLLQQAFCLLIPSSFDVHHLDNTTKTAASAEITRLKAAISQKRADQAAAAVRQEGGL